MTDSLIGKSIGRYQIIAELGAGGMAVVYKAYDTRLERAVALKLIRTGVIGADFHAQILKRFEREARALARLKHPNIVGIHDYGEYNGVPYTDRFGGHAGSDEVTCYKHPCGTRCTAKNLDSC